MNQLPNVANATLDDDKITKYLLNLSHPHGASKAKFFMSLGFSQANWVELKKALLDHPYVNSVTDQTTDQHGDKYEVSCALVTPNGRNPCIISVWIIEPPDPDP